MLLLILILSVQCQVHLLFSLAHTPICEGRFQRRQFTDSTVGGLSHCYALYAYVHQAQQHMHHTSSKIRFT